MSFWKILRVLTTNACNYKCVFCHNEGQNRFFGSNAEFLNFNNFKSIVSILLDSGLKEIQFSGGEPFMNSDTIRMIEWIDENSNLEIGCATNTHFFSDEIIQRLSTTRTALHIQFPSLDRAKFRAITKSHLFDNLIENLWKLKKANVSFSLNYVLQTSNIRDFQNLLPFLLENEISLKIIPCINEMSLKHNDFEKEILPFLNSISCKFANQQNGSLKWGIKTPKDSMITIKYIDSPCFKFDFPVCKNYAEIRLTPNLELQPCLIKNKGNLKLGTLLNEGREKEIKNLFEQSWRNFTHC